MRFLIVSRIYRPEPSAASFFLGGVADALTSAGHEVEVLTAKPLPGQGEGSRGERIRTFPVLRDASGYVRGYVQYMSFDIPLAFRLLFAKRPAAVFVEPPPTTGAVVRVVCAIRRIPYVYDAADIWSDAAGHATSSGLVVRVLRWLETFAMRGAASMVTISQGVVDRVRALGVRSPIAVTGFGADIEVFGYEDREIERTFIYAGTYTPLHGAEVLVDAFAEFSRTHPGYRLRFIGNSTEQESMRQRAENLGVGAAVEFAEAVPAEELRPQLASALASLATLRPGGGYEYAFTSKAYSSLATGCPVIFAGPGPTAPFIERAAAEAPVGVAVDYSPAAIAEAMRNIADHPRTPAQRRQVAAWTAAHHSMRSVSERVADTVVRVGGGAAAAHGGSAPDGSGENPTSEGPAASGEQKTRPGMSGFFGAIANWAVKHRSKMPRWAQRTMESAARNPDGLVGRLAGRLLGGGSAPVTTVPEADVRVYIAPTNYAGQGHLWGRALEAADSRIAARNMAVELPGGFAFPADTLVPIAAVNASSEWAEAEWEAARRFTHVLVEAERSMFGKRFGRDLEAEIAALEAEGISVAFLCHGTDVRDPDRHMELTPWSPYLDDPRVDDLREDARENLALLGRLPRPTFISTPDLAVEVPSASWCPVVVDPERFASDGPVLTGGPARVIHASSNAVQKGSDRIEPALAELVAEGLVEYELITAVPTSEMPRVFSAADIVLDQFRLGSYGVAACEAMAAGRIVVGHVLPFVRERVLRDFGIELPIVEATPDTLREVVEGLIRDPDRSRAIAAAGPAFVRRVHSGEASARALIDGWIERPSGR